MRKLTRWEKELVGKIGVDTYKRKVHANLSKMTVPGYGGMLVEAAMCTSCGANNPTGVTNCQGCNTPIAAPSAGTTAPAGAAPAAGIKTPVPAGTAPAAGVKTPVPAGAAPAVGIKSPAGAAPVGATPAAGIKTPVPAGAAPAGAAPAPAAEAAAIDPSNKAVVNTAVLTNVNQFLTTQKLDDGKKEAIRKAITDIVYLELGKAQKGTWKQQLGGAISGMGQFLGGTPAKAATNRFLLNMHKIARLDSAITTGVLDSVSKALAAAKDKKGNAIPPTVINAITEKIKNHNVFRGGWLERGVRAVGSGIAGAGRAVAEGVGAVAKAPGQWLTNVGQGMMQPQQLPATASFTGWYKKAKSRTMVVNG
jgi:hypothetical protein